MIASISRRRPTFVVVLALLAVVCPAWAGAASADAFHLSGTYVITSQKGTHQEVALTGTATPGGDFTGVALAKQTADGDVKGKVILDFGNGDTLTYQQELTYDPASGLIVGTYRIIGGTGALHGASGSGTTSIDPTGDGTGTFKLDGTLSR